MPAPEGTGTENLPVRTPILDPVAAWKSRLHQAASGVVSRSQVEHALSHLPRVERSGLGMPFGGRQTVLSPRSYERERWYLTLSPGTVRVHRRLVAPKEKLWDDDGVTDAAGTLRGAITEFSRKSRANMFATLPALDYTPMFASGNATAMVTLTLPGRHWEELVPDLRTVAKMRARFQRAYSRAWGSMPVAVWKLEFQRRGAPHLHLFMAPPTGHARGRVAKGAKPLRFPEWLSITWASIVDPSKGTRFDDVQAFRDHVAAGTGIDYVEGTRFSDPKRIAAYFSKHGTYRDKDYQNEIPEHWRAEILESGRGGARFWGYWQLDKAEVTVELEPRRGGARRAAFLDGEPVMHRTEPLTKDDEGVIVPHYVRWSKTADATEERVKVMRHLRKLARARAWVAPVTVPRMRFDLDTGEVTVRLRKVRRRRALLEGRSSGFLVVNDGAAVGTDIARLLGYPPEPRRRDFALVS